MRLSGHKSRRRRRRWRASSDTQVDIVAVGCATLKSFNVEIAQHNTRNINIQLENFSVKYK